MSRPNLAVVVWCMIVAAASAACGRSPLLTSEVNNTLPPPSSTPSATTAPILTSTLTVAPTKTPTPHDVPPVVIIDGPSDAIVSEHIVLDASNSFDYDGDHITYSWSQVHNPDRYTGTKYITGNEVVVENPDSPVLAFVPEWPGSYMFQVSAGDRDGETIAQVEVLVRPSEENFQYKGIALDWCCEIAKENQNQLLDDVISIGANVVEIVPIGCMPDIRSTEILSYPGVAQSPNGCVGNLSDEFLSQLIDEVHARNLQVMLAPQIQGFGEGGEFFWTGGINPTSWAEWFMNYERFVLHYANIAQEKQVRWFQLANELNTSQPMTIQWREIIAKVRETYFGDIGIGVTLTWHAGWPQVRFWDRLDFIGFHFWLEATGNQYPVHPSLRQEPSNDPSVVQMRTNLDQQLRWALDPIIESAGLPVLVTELGTSNYDGSNVSHFDAGEAPLDNREQADFYEAALQVLSTRPDVVGVFSWSLDWAGAFPDQIQLDPRAKPAEEVLRLWFGGN